MSEYTEDDYLMLSGIQHFDFCPRQWALIHLEEAWTENYLTASGRVLHKKTHDADSFEKRGDLIIFRAMKISSKLLGLSGECDTVEFYRNPEGITLKGYEGTWLPYPVEYKRGKTKPDDCDRLQLCAQVMCLEEMLLCTIPKGALYYGEPRRREIVIITEELRAKVVKAAKEMHSLFSRQYTPKPRMDKQCQSCSLKNECIPKLQRKKSGSVKAYMESNIE